MVENSITRRTFIRNALYGGGGTLLIAGFTHQRKTEGLDIPPASNKPSPGQSTGWSKLGIENALFYAEVTLGTCMLFRAFDQSCFPHPLNRRAFFGGLIAGAGIAVAADVFLSEVSTRASNP